jgi:hypothetical protein
VSQRIDIRRGSRQAAHNSRMLPRLLAGSVCLLIAAAMGDGAWHLFNAHKQAVSDRAVEQAMLYRAMPAIQTRSKPVVASTARLTPTVLASAREYPAVIRRVTMSGAAPAKSKPNIAKDVESIELAKIRPNIAKDVEGFEKPTAARRAPTTSL